MDILTMGIDFVKEWKGAHPPPRPEDWVAPEPQFTEEEMKKKTRNELICCIGVNILLCGCYSTCGCRDCIKPMMVPEEDEDPYDDGQDDFGVRFNEYVAWKKNLDVGNRGLPRDYQTDFGELADEYKAKAKEAKAKAKAKGLAAFNSSKKFGNKLKSKMKDQMDSNKVMSDSEGGDDVASPQSTGVGNEAVELVVNSGDETGVDNEKVENETDTEPRKETIDMDADDNDEQGGLIQKDEDNGAVVKDEDEDDDENAKVADDYVKIDTGKEE